MVASFNGYQWFALASMIICLGFCLVYGWKIILAGKPKDFAIPSGSANRGVRYAFSGAMHPNHKESAYLHRLTYAAGLFYHAGTFLGFLLFGLLFFQIPIPLILKTGMAFTLLLTGITGFGLLLKRWYTPKIRKLSNPDDYIANILVNLFHWLIAASLWQSMLVPSLFILGGILLIYIPLGKLRHCVFFFAARYHLGFFYGSRGVWPPKP